jgi:Xanthine dehydrogenase, molybdopterin-binding subunit B
MAVQQAAREIKARLSRFASETWNVAEDLISFRDDRVFIGNESVPFGELAKKAYGARVHLSAAGFYKTPKLFWDRDRGKGRPFFYFAYGAACSEVAVDILTGEMTSGESTSSMTSGARSIRRSISARSKAPSCRAWAG